MLNEFGVKALVFDGYGTLFDLESAAPAFEQVAPGHGLEILRWWRAKQLQYTRRCILTRRYRNLWVLMEQAMEDTCLRFQLDISPDQRKELCRQYLTLKVFDEVEDVLLKLREKYKLVILSHGTQWMLDTVTAHNQITRFFDAVLSVDKVQAYKPELRAYELITQTINLPESAFGYVGVNPMDIAGARAFGMKAIWLSRQSPKGRLMEFVAHLTIKDLKTLLIRRYTCS